MHRHFGKIFVRNLRVALVIAAMFASTMLIPGSAPGQTPRQQASFEAVFENDIFMGMIPGRAHSDREYTHGLWIATERNDAPLWSGLFPDIPVCAGADTTRTTCLQTRLEMGQKLFTPYIGAATPSPAERPYAGWLYGALTSRVASRAAARSLRIDLGVTGPPALGEEFQKVIHRITDYPPPMGWDHQLAFEPGLHLQYEERRLLEHRTASRGRVADVVLAANVSVGNVRTGVQGVLSARAGHRLPHPWMRYESMGELAAYVLGEWRYQWLARDLFLDGNTFAESPSVERIATTGEWRLGAGIEYRDVRLQFAYVGEDRLYETQPRPHRYGALTLVVRP